MSFINRVEPQRALRGCELVAHGTTAAAGLLTILLFWGGRARELNAVADNLFWSVGFGATIALALIVLAAVFRLYEHYLEDYPRVILAAAGLLAAFGVIDLAVNIGLFAYTGVPESFWWEGFLKDFVLVIAGFIAAVSRNRLAALATRIETPSVPVRSFVVVAVAIVLVVSIIGPFAWLGGVVDTDHVGSAQAATASGETVYSGADDGYVRAHDPDTGDVIWETSVVSSSFNIENLAVGPDGDTLYAVDSGTNITELDASTGDIQSHVDAPYSGDDFRWLDISDDGSALYAGGSGGPLAKYSTSDFSEQWESPVAMDMIQGGVHASGGRVFAVDGSGTAYELDTADGSQLWSYSTGASFARGISASPDEASAYAGDSSNNVTKLNATDGSQSDVTTLADQAGMVEAGPGGDWVYVGLQGASGDLYQLGAGGLSTSYQAATNGNSWLDMALTPQAGGVLKADAAGIHKYDAADGSELFSATGFTTSDVQAVTVGSPGDAVSGDITGRVTDQNGDAVKNATVYTADWSTADPPQITTNRDLSEIQDHPFPSGWDQQLDVPGVTETVIDPSEPDWSSTRVLMHTAEQWELQGPQMGRSIWEQIWTDEPRSEVVNPEVDLEEPKAAIAPEQAAVLTCWEFDDSNLNVNILDHPDPMDDSIPGAATQPCTMVIEEVDPIDGTYSKRTEETHPFVEYDAKIYSRVDDKTHEAVFWRPSEGVYKVYPEDSPETAMYYVVAPGADPSNHKAKIANVAKSKEKAISKFNERMQEEYDAGNLDIVSTTTNSSGYYGLNVQSAVDETDVIAIKPGTTREDVRSNIESVTRQNFRARAPTSNGVNYDGWQQPQWETFCEEMDSVMAETGVPFEGHARNVQPPNDNVNIQGVRSVPPDVNQEVSECFAINTAEKMLQDGLSGLFPGMQDNLADLSREDLEQRYREVLAFIEGSQPLESELDSRLDGDIDTILEENPEDLTRGELEDRVSEGIETIDSGGDTGFSGGGGSVTSPPTVSPPDTGTGQETLNAVWQVGQVDNWNDASLLVRLHYSNGTTTLLNGSSEHITIEESTVGADTVRLSDYPLGETDPATVQVGLDVATPDGSAGDPDDGSGVVRNPTFDGDVPSLRDMRVSKFAPGPSDNVTIDVTPDESSRFGALKHANVSHPDCSYSTPATDGELDIWTCGEGSHHVKVTFTNPGGVEFVEVLNLDAKAAAQTRPASIRAKVGPVGRYAVTNGQLAGGDIQTTDGASTLEVIAIAEPDNVPNSITASTIGMDVAPDSNTLVRVVEGDARQTVRKRIGVVLHRNAPSEGSLLYRNERAVPTNGETSSARIETANGKLTMDSFTSETGVVALRVVEDPNIIQRIRHWADLKTPFTLPAGFISGDAVLFLAPLVVYRRRRKRPPNTGNGGTQEVVA